jgi:hypothetical protein
MLDTVSASSLQLTLAARAGCYALHRDCEIENFREALFKTIVASRRTFRWFSWVSVVSALRTASMSPSSCPWGEDERSRFVTSKVLTTTFMLLDSFKMLQIIGAYPPPFPHSLTTPVDVCEMAASASMRAFYK